MNVLESLIQSCGIETLLIMAQWSTTYEKKIFRSYGKENCLFTNNLTKHQLLYSKWKKSESGTCQSNR